MGENEIFKEQEKNKKKSKAGSLENYLKVNNETK